MQQCRPLASVACGMEQHVQHISLQTCSRGACRIPGVVLFLGNKDNRMYALQPNNINRDCGGHWQVMQVPMLLSHAAMSSRLHVCRGPVCSSRPGHHRWEPSQVGQQPTAACAPSSNPNSLARTRAIAPAATPARTESLEAKSSSVLRARRPLVPP
jgi:hypothetical protein